MDLDISFSQMDSLYTSRRVSRGTAYSTCISCIGGLTGVIPGCLTDHISWLYRLTSLPASNPVISLFQTSKYDPMVQLGSDQHSETCSTIQLGER